MNKKQAKIKTRAELRNGLDKRGECDTIGISPQTPRDEGEGERRGNCGSPPYRQAEPVLPPRILLPYRSGAILSLYPLPFSRRGETHFPRLRRIGRPDERRKGNNNIQFEGFD